MNEVHENFKELTANNQIIDNDDFLDEKVQKSRSYNHGTHILHDVLDQHPDLRLASKYNDAALMRHNNVKDVLTREL